ncbi:MAG: dihydroorotase [Gammaproteobacteria bacterium]|nr:dihydroorotase [Gammaproteobacteria bacterium]
MDKITLLKPDDWHLHFRDTPYLSRTVSDTANQFGRAIVMPNLAPPVRNREDAEAYYARIKAHIPQGNSFQPLMTIYITDHTSVEDIQQASESAFIFAAKLYPAGATTNSAFGVSDIGKLDSIFEAMQKHDLPLLMHGESIGIDDDVFDREKIFIDQTLIPLRKKFPQLRIVFEHITTKNAVDYVSQANDYLGATITPQHLLINRNALFKGGIRPHHYCLPVVKREEHRVALNKVAISGNSHFFAGTDSAPHSTDKKESSCGCAGIYSASHAIELYAEAFEKHNDFTHFERFMSKNGANFYKLKPHESSITLIKEPWKVDESLSYGNPVNNETLTPFMAGEVLQWKIKND